MPVYHYVEILNTYENKLWILFIPIMTSFWKHVINVNSHKLLTGSGAKEE